MPKVASTAWMLTFAGMNNIPKYDIKEMVNSMSLHDYLFNEFSIKIIKPEDVSITSEFCKMMFVRHPFERLVSAFHDKFIVIKQKNLMVPFIDYYLRSIGMKKPKNIRQSWIDKYVDVTFKNFVEFVLYESSQLVKINDGSGHWWPYTDMCKMCDISYDYIGRLETLSKDVDCILDKFSKHNSLHQMKERIKKKVNASGHHNKNMTIDYFSQLSRTTILKLYEMYKDDFVLGGYEYPQKYVDVGSVL